MTTQLALGMRTSCSDGFCGVVRRMILDPATRTITHLVIEPRHRGMDGRLVPLDLADMTAGEVTLRCTMAEFGRLDPAEDVELADGPCYGTEIGMPLVYGPQAVVSDTVPPGETDLVRHERVHAVDGEIGQIEGFVVNSSDHKVTHVLLKEGHLWGRKEVAIPVSAVAAMENGIRLNITKEQVQDLPPRDRA